MAPLVASLVSLLGVAGTFAAAAPSLQGRRIKIRATTPEAVPNSYMVRYNVTAGHDAILAHQAAAAKLIASRPAITVEGSGSSAPAYFNISSFIAMHVYADETTIHEIGSDASVAWVSTDGIGDLHATVTQTNAPDGLSRISHAQVEQGNSLTYRYDDSGGEGITAYILDSGINITHPDFGGRARYGRNIPSQNDDAADTIGHGTQIASILGGNVFGVAKKVQLVSVVVAQPLSGRVSWFHVMQGMQWAYDDAMANNRLSKSVINMSLGGRTDAQAGGTELIDLSNQLVEQGMVIVASAGNDGADASDYAPASARNIITVGGIDQRTDEIWRSDAGSSNWGPPVDIFAPSVNVHGAYLVDPANLNSSYPDIKFSGTSQASPHVAGICAYLMRLEGLSTPAAVTARVLQLAGATGASVKNNQPNTTGLIANNGFK